MPSADAILPDWARAHGEPLVQGLIKQSPQDFKVDEVLGFIPSGGGEHDFLLIEKTDSNTTWVARQLAQHANIATRDVGYAGMKDRHAVTTQWFSIRRPTGFGTDWGSLELRGVQILEQTRHSRKLKRGAHRGNKFRIIIREPSAPRDAIEKRLQTITDLGVPNYFGLQRFGHAGNNLELAKRLFAGGRLKRDQRSIALSAARSFLFNEILATRVGEGSWNSVTVGEAVNLDGTNSIFTAESVDAELIERIRSLDVHPTAALWGRGPLQCSGESSDKDCAAAAKYAELATGLERHGVSILRRATRLKAQGLDWNISDSTLELVFRLGSGGFATALLRELIT